MEYPAVTDLIYNKILPQIKAGLAADPASTGRISVIQMQSPFWEDPSQLQPVVTMIVLFDRYISYNQTFSTGIVSEAGLMATDGQRRLRMEISKLRPDILHDDCYDENLYNLFYGYFSINPEMVVVPRYHPEEIVSWILFNTEPVKWSTRFLDSYFDPSIPFIMGSEYYDKDFFVGQFPNYSVNDAITDVRIKGKKYKLYFRTSSVQNGLTWVQPDEIVNEASIMASVAGYLNAKLNYAELPTFEQQYWSLRIPNLVRACTYYPYYLGYVYQRG